MGVRVAPGMLYLRSIMEECNGLLIRRLQVRILSQILWQRTLIGKRLAWKASVAVKRDEGSSPFAVVDRDLFQILVAPTSWVWNGAVSLIGKATVC